jgi:hypothetical protein
MEKGRWAQFPSPLLSAACFPSRFRARPSDCTGPASPPIHLSLSQQLTNGTHGIYPVFYLGTKPGVPRRRPRRATLPRRLRSLCRPAHHQPVVDKLAHVADLAELIPFPSPSLSASPRGRPPRHRRRHRHGHLCHAHRQHDNG